MPERLAQDAGPIHIDLSGIGDAFGNWIMSHLHDLGTAIWTPLSDWFIHGIQDSARETWLAIWHSDANLITQLPAALTYDFPPYRALVDADPLVLIVGTATLAVVLLGIRVAIGSMTGADHVLVHVFGRLIPSVALAIAYPVLIVDGTQLLNRAATDLGAGPIGRGIADGLLTALLLPLAVLSGVGIFLAAPLLILWLIEMWYGVKLIIRMAYSLYRFLLALLFGPLAILLWAIPQTEWITTLWLHELLGWGTTPLLVTALLALSIPMASAQGGIIAAILFGIAGLQAAHDIAGLLSMGRRGGRSLFPNVYGAVSTGMRAGGAMAGAPAAAPLAANQVTTMADMYGYQ